MRRCAWRVLCATVVIGSVAVRAAEAGQAPAAPANEWTGIEVGGHVGGNWSHTDSQTVVTGTGVSEGSGSSSASHITGGFQGGYLYMMPSHLVVGVAAGEASWGLNDTSTTTSGNNVHTNASKTNWTGSLTGQVGYAAGRALVYGAVGVGWSSSTVTRTQVTGATGNAVPGTVETLNVNLAGFTGGGGLSYAVVPHVHMFVDYRYSPRTHTNTFPLAQRSTTSTTNTSGVQFGVNYRF